MLPENAHQLGRRMRDGRGEYYRELMVPRGTLQHRSNCHYVSRCIDNGKADHPAHAEAYCRMAANIPLGRAHMSLGARPTGSRLRRAN